MGEHSPRRTFLIGISALSLLCASAGHAQRPDFSGEWVRSDSAEQRSVASVGDAGFRVGTPGSGWGSPLTIRQEANRLVVEYVFFGTYDLQPRLSFTFALDGSETRNRIMLSHAESVLRSRAVWRDSALEITTTFPTPPGVSSGGEVQQILTLQSPRTLLLETRRGDAVLRTTFVRR